MARMSRRGPWLPEEDGALIDLVRTQGPNNWVRISQQLQHRSPKQCRERYHQNLKPSLNHEPISAAEGEMIEQLVHERGKRWAEIARHLGNRSDNAVKNWWNGSMNRRKRNPMQHNGVRQVGNRLHPISNSMSARSPFEHHASAPSLPQSRHLTNISAVHKLSMQNSTHAPELRLKGNSDSNLVGPLPYRDSSLSQNSSSYFTNVTQHPSPSPSPFLHEESSKLAPLRLPGLSLHQGARRSPLSYEQPLPSPSTSEFSYSLSSKEVPSLVSDSQSAQSISPRTFGSPGLITPPEETGQQAFRRSDSMTNGFDYRSPQEVTAPSYWCHHDTMAFPGATKSNNTGTLTLPLARLSPIHLNNSFDVANTFRTESRKDSRMNLSRLVQ